MTGEDVYVSVDVEADGPIPGDYSLLSLGACVVGRPDAAFYRELRPVSDRFVPEALAVSGLDRAELARRGAEPRQAMQDFAAWVREVSGGGRPVFVAFNATFDWMFVHWYFAHFGLDDPFGLSGLDVKAYYMAALKKRRWSETARGNLEARFRPDLPHTHHALDDAREQAEVFRRIREHVLAGS